MPRIRLNGKSDIPYASCAKALAPALIFYLLMGGPVLAAGTDSGTTGSTRTCPRGTVWDSKTERCVKAQSGVLPDKQLTEYAFALAKAKRYDEALEVLDLLKGPNTAQALNYRGYAPRKLGRLDEGISYYLKSVALDPHYAQVREYLGEAYVIKGDTTSARAQLSVIKTICGTNCEEFKDLAKAIATGS